MCRRYPQQTTRGHAPQSHGWKLQQDALPFVVLLTVSSSSVRHDKMRVPDPSPRHPADRQACLPAPTCKRCGGPVPRRSRVYCDGCLPHYQREQYASAFHGSGLAAIEHAKKRGVDPTHGDTSGECRASSNISRKREAREWDERHGKLVDLSAFERDILPLIKDVPLSRLQRATGLPLRYVSLIRRGERTPHPRHWQAFLAAARVPSGPAALRFGDGEVS